MKTMPEFDEEFAEVGSHGPKTELTSYRVLIPVLFLVGRLVLILTLPVEGLAGYGDHWNFYRLAGLGRPMIDYWVEFPPLFPWISAGLFELASGREHTYQYLLVILLSLFQTGNLFLFFDISRHIHPLDRGFVRASAYALLLVGLGYGWWYFDPLAVFFTLLAVHWTISERAGLAGLAVAFGILAKWFPIMALPLIWRRVSARSAFLATALAVSLVAAVWLFFFAISPDFTAASLRAQFGRGSWETVWALLDGNLVTGNLGPDVVHTQPETVMTQSGDPPVISPWLTLLPFATLGGWLFWKSRLESAARLVEFLGLTWCLFLIWSPGYSPQWMLYLLPLILLALPNRLAFLMSVALLGINLLEWPLLLSRGWFWSLAFIVPIRTVILGLLGYEFWRRVRPHRSAAEINATHAEHAINLPPNRGLEG